MVRRHIPFGAEEVSHILSRLFLCSILPYSIVKGKGAFLGAKNVPARLADSDPDRAHEVLEMSRRRRVHAAR
jgi:hypothetical protein